MEETSSCSMKKEAENANLLNLPPGFRFHPTDEEIISYYLSNKTMNSNFTAIAIGEADFNACEPWDLPKLAKMGENEWYFFCRRDRKYPTGTRTNRATESGYWKATGKDREVLEGKMNVVGMKKTLVFYIGRAPRGQKTNWVMHEYRLLRSSKDEWVVCKVVQKPMKKVLPPPPQTNLLIPDGVLPQTAAFCFEGSAFSAACLLRQQMPTSVKYNPVPGFRNEDRHDDVSGAVGERRLDRMVEWLDETRSMVSHDTGLTGDASAEISSVSMSKVGMKSADGWAEGDDPVQLEHMPDLDCLWNY